VVAPWQLLTRAGESTLRGSDLYGVQITMEQERHGSLPVTLKGMGRLEEGLQRHGLYSETGQRRLLTVVIGRCRGAAKLKRNNLLKLTVV
jgi:hypothetical protein